jgi:DNA-binding NtrC family response regulator
MADRGTIFLDEIGDISPKLQADLLRVLQERRFYRVGGNEEVQLDVRVIAATHKDLAEEVQQGRFREDLYYRLNVIEIRLPALRDRREDIPLLAEHFVQRISSELGKDITSVSAAALKVLIAHDWPGNVRELENAIERAIVTCRNGVLEEEDFSWLRRQPAAAQEWQAPDLPLDELERRAIIAALERKHGNVKEASAALGIDRSTLYDKLKRYDIPH